MYNRFSCFLCYCLLVRTTLDYHNRYHRYIATKIIIIVCGSTRCCGLEIGVLGWCVRVGSKSFWLPLWPLKVTHAILESSFSLKINIMLVTIEQLFFWLSKDTPNHWGLSALERLLNCKSALRLAKQWGWRFGDHLYPQQKQHWFLLNPTGLL